MAAVTFSAISASPCPTSTARWSSTPNASTFYVIMPPTTIHHDESAIGQMCDDVFGPKAGERSGLRISPPATAPGSSFSSSRRRFRKTAPSNTGARVSVHFCLQDERLEERVKLIESMGGRQRMQQVRHYFPGQKPYRMVYVEDPFGNVFELYSHSYELTYSAGAYV
jgi:hypothetical protein